MPSESNISKLVNQLTRATVEGSLDWERGMLPEALEHYPDRRVMFYCQAEYKGQTVAVFERQVQKYDPERDIDVTVSIPGIALVNGSDVIWQNSENISSLSTLLRVARENTFGVEDIFKSLLE